MATAPEKKAVVKFPMPGVVPPIVPGAAKVAPPNDDAFRLATTVVDATVKGAVPVVTDEVNRDALSGASAESSASRTCRVVVDRFNAGNADVAPKKYNIPSICTGAVPLD